MVQARDLHKRRNGASREVNTDANGHLAITVTALARTLDGRIHGVVGADGIAAAPHLVGLMHRVLEHAKIIPGLGMQPWE